MDTSMAWANEDPSKLSCKRTCKVWTVVQAVQFSLFGAMVVHAVKPYLSRTQHFDCIQPSRDSYGYMYPSDKCVFAGRFPSATRWHGSQCDPREMRQQYDSADVRFLPSFSLALALFAFFPLLLCYTRQTGFSFSFWILDVHSYEVLAWLWISQIDEISVSHRDSTALKAYGVFTDLRLSSQSTFIAEQIRAGI